MTDLKKLAEEFFDVNCNHGYGCCFEYPSVRKDSIKAIEKLIEKVRNDTIEECIRIVETPGLANPGYRLQALKTKQGGGE